MHLQTILTTCKNSKSNFFNYLDGYYCTRFRSYISCVYMYACSRLFSKLVFHNFLPCTARINFEFLHKQCKGKSYEASSLNLNKLSCYACLNFTKEKTILCYLREGEFGGVLVSFISY